MTAGNAGPIGLALESHTCMQASSTLSPHKSYPPQARCRPEHDDPQAFLDGPHRDDARPATDAAPLLFAVLASPARL